MRGNMNTLPKWAQQEIDRLTRDLEYVRAKLAAGPEDSDTFADAFSETRRPLGTGTVIDFQFGEGWGKKFQARLEGDTLKINGGSGIAVLPRASNVVEIRMTD